MMSFSKYMYPLTNGKINNAEVTMYVSVLFVEY